MLDCLIADDEKEIADNIAEYFEMFDLSAAAVYSYEAVLRFLEETPVRLLILDVNLGEKSGFALCRELRRKHTLPILFISARNSESDILTGLTIGGDDYLTKPFKLEILLAKVKIMLRRAGLAANKADRFTYKGLTVDYQKHKVYVRDCEIPLKNLEYKLLCYLIENQNRVISKTELLDKVWNDAYVGEGTLSVHIRHIREKIEANPNKPELIQTIWGTGYVFEVQDA